MTLDSSSSVDRFHRVLVDEIRDRRPDYLTGPFTVAEIYQHLVPYASHRDRLGVEMNGDYEDLLLRLLAGEGDYVVVESEHARERMKNEIESPSPDTSLYREFAAVDVRLNPDRVEEGAGADTAADDEPLADDASEEDPDGGDDGFALAGPTLHTDSTESEVEDLPGDADPDLPSDEEAASAASDQDDEAGAPAHPERAPACPWCRETLPERANLNYCPFCGTDVGVVPCPSCGEALEPGWLFCIACGTSVSEE